MYFGIQVPNPEKAKTKNSVEPKLYINTLLVRILLRASLNNGFSSDSEDVSFLGFPLIIVCCSSSKIFRFAASVFAFGNLSGNRTKGPKKN